MISNLYELNYICKGLHDVEAGLKESLADDLNTAKCMNELENLVTQCNGMLHCQKQEDNAREPASVHVVKESVQNILQSFGLLQRPENNVSSSLHKMWVHKVRDAFLYKHITYMCS